MNLSSIQPVVDNKYTSLRCTCKEFPEDEGQTHVCYDGQKPRSRDMSRQTSTLVFTSLRSTCELIDRNRVAVRRQTPSKKEKFPATYEAHTLQPGIMSQPTSEPKAPPADGSATTTPAPKRASRASWFDVPAPLARLFRRFPLVTYPANDLPVRSPKNRHLPTLYVFASEHDALKGLPSFNPSCLKWQVCIQFIRFKRYLLPNLELTEDSNLQRLFSS